MAGLNFSSSLPSLSLHFGSGALGKLGKIATKHGKRALLVTGRGSMRKLGFLGKTIDALEHEGVSVILFDKVPANPTVSLVDEGIALARKERCDIIIALGGGSAIDAAKGIAVGAAHLREGESIWRFVPTERKENLYPTAKTLPLIAIPSTSGSGSHATPFAVLTNEKTGEKATIRSPFIFPRESLCDLDIVSKMPKKLTAESGFDALCHLMESYLSKRCTPITELFALRGMELVAESLHDAYSRGGMPVREKIALADTFAGISISMSGAILPHSLSHPISGHHPELSHGEALAAITPAIMEFNIEHGDKSTIEKYCNIARIFGEKTRKRGKTGALASVRVEGRGRAGKADALKSVRAIEKLLKSIGLAKKLGGLGVREEELPLFADDVWECMRGGILNNPAEIRGKGQLIEIYRRAL